MSRTPEARGFLQGLPRATPEDVRVLRELRDHRLDLAQVERLLQALPRPSAEVLRRRPILDGEPFRL